jgi:hypothetical protein
MSQAEILKEAERMVRAALRDDLKQQADDDTIKAVALKVAKTIPASTLEAA